MGKLISRTYTIKYLERLIPKLFKLMPLKESSDVNYNLYLDKLVTQLLGFKKIVVFSPMLLDIICNLEGLKNVSEIRMHNSIVKECINICQKSIDAIRLELEGDSDGV